MFSDNLPGCLQILSDAEGRGIGTEDPLGPILFGFF
jgi:hypothetical protein